MDNDIQCGNCQKVFSSVNEWSAHICEIGDNFNQVSQMERVEDVGKTFWNERATKLLLSEMSKLADVPISKRKKAGKVFIVMKEYGYEYSVDQILNKWGNLLKSLKKKKDNDKKTGAGSMDLALEEEIEKAVGNSHAVNPIFAMGVAETPVFMRSEVRPSTSKSSTPKKSPLKTARRSLLSPVSKKATTPKKYKERRNTSQSKASTLALMRRDIKDHMENMLQVKKEFNDQVLQKMEARNVILKDYTDAMKRAFQVENNVPTSP